MIGVEKVRKYLSGIEPTVLSDNQRREIEHLLANCWGSVDGSLEGGMAAEKLINRTENMEWRPPLLTFVIERHGGFVNGSSRAELQHWEVNLDSRKARIAKTGKRQLTSMDKPLKVKPIAEEIAQIIGDGIKNDPRVKWKNQDCVRVLVSEIIPQTNKQTTAGRRARFAGELISLMRAFGWHRKDAGTFLYFSRGTEP